MDRAEHMKRCKERAMEFVNKNDLEGAYTSMSSDLRNHDETVNHPVIELGMQMLMGGHLNTQDKMQHFIEGTN